MTPEDKEILRHALIEELAARHPVPVSARGLLGKMAVTVLGRVTLEDVLSALTLLQDLTLADVIPDGMGGTTWWRATAAGVLRVERGSQK